MSAPHYPERFPRRTATTAPDGRALVGFGFRCWFLGYATGDIACWEVGWNTYCSSLGARGAKRVFGELSCWGRAIRANAARPMEVYPLGCRGFARDECLAVSLVAAAQEGACPALKACTFALLESAHVDPVIEQTEAFSTALAHEGVVIDSCFIVDGAACAAADQPRRLN